MVTKATTKQPMMEQSSDAFHDENINSQPDRLAIPHHDALASPLHTTKYMILFSFWIGYAAWVGYFDQGFSGIVLEMASFNQAFGVCAMVKSPVTGAMVEQCMLTATQQSINSISSLFSALGAFICGYTGNYLGRRGALQVGVLLVIIGASGMLGTAGNFAAYNVCKCINALGIGHVTAGGPMYGVECTPPRRRGTLLALYTIGINVGSVVIAATCLGSSTLTTNWAWQTPILCQIPTALFFGVGLMMFPESPRWLLTKGREEKARKSFGKFYDFDPYSEIVTIQIREVQDGIDFEKSLSSTTSWTEIFHRSYIRRTLVSAFILFSTSLCGITFLASYGAVFIADVGISNPFLVLLIFTLCNFAGSLMGPFILEYLGRRAGLLIGYSCMTSCLLIFSAVCSGLGSTSDVAQKVLVAFLCLYVFTFGAFAAPASWLAQAEVHSVRLRTYGTAFTASVFYIVAFATAFWTPYMINPQYGNMGSNVGYFWSGLGAILIIVTYLYVPETARLTLEQIDDYFVSERRAWRTSLKRNKRIANGEIADISAEARSEAIQRIRGKESGQ